MGKLHPFTARVVEIVDSIPFGCVATYGQIADMAGNHRAARQVVRILHSSSHKYDLPWHRVVNREGRIALKDSIGADKQRQLLMSEGVHVDATGRLDLEARVWDPAALP